MRPPDPAERLLTRAVILLGGFERAAHFLAVGMEEEAFESLRLSHKNAVALKGDLRQQTKSQDAKRARA